MNATSMPDASRTTATSLEHASFPHLSAIEWEALHRLAAVSGDAVIKALLTAGTEEQQRLAAQEFMARELADLRQRVSTPTQTKNKSDIVKPDASTYSGEGEGRLHLNRWFCEVDIAIEARQLSTELARTRFLLSKLAGKAKEWALGKPVADASCFPTMASMKTNLRLAFEPPQDESVLRSTFLALKQGRMFMLEYVQRARHLVSCITTHPVDMATQVHVFISDMSAGYQRFYLTRKTPPTLEEAFAVAFLEDYSVTASQAFVVSRAPVPEPADGSGCDSTVRWTSGADVISKAATGLVNAQSPPDALLPLWETWTSRGYLPRSGADAGERHGRVRRRRSKNQRQPVDAGRPTGRGRSDGSLVAKPPPCPPVLHAQRFATTSGSDTRLIVLSLHVDGATRPLRALLDSGATNNFVRAESLSVLPTDMNIRDGPGDMIVKYADGKPRRTPWRSATFAYEFDGFRNSEEFLVIELSGSVDCVFGIPWLARHQPEINWLTGTVRP
ncbi:unnamed protein product [Phytophthora fragariaefolia]|uniref:Unnamed protein product n=1 Tax=Phytophthora fragariaefolia TaxID=1490495 RepID=A0A9W7D1V8_9STRA|nr:unnamed protein product [Phytophthora fragariaefolia]